MRFALPFLALALLAAPAPARPTLPPISAEELALYLPDGASVEVRLDADVTGDGIRDTVALGQTEEERRLVVLAGYVEEVDRGHRPIGQMTLGLSPLGSASLRMANGVLLVNDLTGGTTAVASLYRFRHDRAADRMRLIGDDVELYSRTFAHDGLKISTNRLTGSQIRTATKLTGRGAKARYLPAPPQTRRVPRAPVFMEEVPDPSETLGWGD